MRLPEFEGYHRRLMVAASAYLCPAGVVTIGSGLHRRREMGDVWKSGTGRRRRFMRAGHPRGGGYQAGDGDITGPVTPLSFRFRYNPALGTPQNPRSRKLNAGDPAGLRMSSPSSTRRR